MTTGLTFGQRQRTSIPIDQRVLARQLMSGVQTANQMNPAANIQPLAQPMAQPMAQGQGPSFRFQTSIVTGKHQTLIV